MNHQTFITQAIELALHAIKTREGGPFGALVVKDGKVIGKSSNTVFKDYDPTAHAEVQAIRDACKNEQVHSLEGCILYTSCEPCPMCYGAVHYAKIKKVYYAVKHIDADRIAGFGVEKIYENLNKKVEDRNPKHIQILEERGELPFREWVEKGMDKINLKKGMQK